MDLAKFLAARLDDDEAAAKAAFGPGIALNWPALPAAVDVFIDRYGPLRAVREVDAKRKIVAVPAPGYPNNYPQRARQPACGICHSGGWDWDPEQWPCATVRALAAVWSDHPGYDPAWKE